MLFKFFALVLAVRKAVFWLADYIPRKKRKRAEVLWPDHATSEEQLLQLRCDLERAVRRMENNPQTTEDEWRDILALCEYSNEWYSRVYPDRSIINARRLENHVWSKIFRRKA